MQLQCPVFLFCFKGAHRRFIGAHCCFKGAHRHFGPRRTVPIDVCWRVVIDVCQVTRVWLAALPAIWGNTPHTGTLDVGWHPLLKIATVGHVDDLYKNIV